MSPCVVRRGRHGDTDITSAGAACVHLFSAEATRGVCGCRGPRYLSPIASLTDDGSSYSKMRIVSDNPG